jgi:hypothetical protein
MLASAMQFAYARGRTDFRGLQASYGHRVAGCVFCALEPIDRVLLENELFREALRCWGIDGANQIRPFSREQERFLEAHRQVLRR